jgi:2-methylisocitrate lyase-like PEP mutase family enzyme
MNTAHPGTRLKAALAQPGLISAPGVYDMISAKIADGLGFPALYMTGYGVSASHLGLPDAGLASYTEMVSRVAQICQGTATPVICDADTGFGGLLNVERTVRGYEAAGAAAIQIEDQVFPKRCGHTPGRRVVPIEDMVRKVKVAAASRSSPDFLIVARTDARTNHGLDEALRRGEAFAKAGADILFIESPESEEEMARIGKHFDLPLLANMADGGRTPILPKARLEQLGYGRHLSRHRLPRHRQGARPRLRRAQGDGIERHAGVGVLPVRQVLPPGRLRSRLGVREALARGMSPVPSPHSSVGRGLG